MVRVLLLSLAGSISFAGFALIFLLPDTTGLIAGSAIVIFGAVTVWLVEQHTRKSLDADTTFNRLMKADGEDFVLRDRKDRGQGE